jgi:hypothetical protein
MDRHSLLLFESFVSMPLPHQLGRAAVDIRQPIRTRLQRGKSTAGAGTQVNQENVDVAL